MILTYTYNNDEPQTIKAFVKEQGISKGLLATIKFQGGHIQVNGVTQNVLYVLQKGDCLTLDIPAEQSKDHIVDDPTPLSILFEDDHLLVVNKPPYVASIPVKLHPTNTMVNRVSYYYHQQGYEDDVVHTVTRLDRDTSGVMVFARHRLSHAKLDRQLRQKTMKKYYVAYVNKSEAIQQHGFIDKAIDRRPSSTIERMTVQEGGKTALTEYWLENETKEYMKVRVQLHTGRTHQIRVHFASLQAPLIGDDLYGQPSHLIQRQALHCQELTLIHPFTGEEMTFKAPLPKDMENFDNKIVDEIESER